MPFLPPNQQRQRCTVTQAISSILIIIIIIVIVIIYYTRRQHITQHHIYKDRKKNTRNYKLKYTKIGNYKNKSYSKWNCSTCISSEQFSWMTSKNKCKSLVELLVWTDSRVLVLDKTFCQILLIWTRRRACFLGQPHQSNLLARYTFWTTVHRVP